MLSQTALSDPALTAPLDALTTEELRSLLSSVRVDGPSNSFSNWAGTYSCTPASIFYVTQESQLRYLVELAKREKKVLRAFGAGHSPSDLVCVGEDEGWLVNLDKLDALIDVDQEKRIVTVQAGIRLRDLHPVLASHGLALSSLGSISDQSLAGAISTATHGSSYSMGNLSTFVSSLSIILADDTASFITCSQDSESDIFNASLCGLGVTGIITRISIRCERRFNLEEEEFSMTTPDFLDVFENGLPSSSEHVRAWWHPQCGEVRVSRMNRTNRPITIGGQSTFLQRLKAWVGGRVLGYHWHQVGLLIGRLFPNFLSWHARFMYKHTIKPGCFFDPTPAAQQHLMLRAPPSTTEKSDADPSYPRCSPTNFRVGPSVSIFNYDCLFPQYTYEGVVPLDKARACLGEMVEWLEGEMQQKDGMRHHFPIEIRFSDADDVWLSSTYGWKGCYIGIVQYKPYGLPVSYRNLFTRFEDILFAHSGRPHWAKTHSASLATLTKLFPKLPDFLRARERADPMGVFLNPYTRRHLLGESDTKANDPRRFKSSGRQKLDEALLLDEKREKKELD